MSRNAVTIKILAIAAFAVLFVVPVVNAEISISNNITISATVDGSGVATSTNPTNPPSPSVSSGGGGFMSTGAVVNISGRAFPLSRVTVLQDSVPVVVTIAGPDAKFSASVTGLTPRNYNFAVYGQDSVGRKSETFSFPLVVSPNTTVDISGIFIAPTISLDKTEVAKGDNITIFGESTPNSKIVISIHSDEEIFRSVTTDKNGVYSYTFDTSPLELGSHVAKSKTVLSDTVSPYGALVDFIVGTKNVSKPQTCGIGIGDLNCDYSVGIIDYSIMAYWYGRPNPPANIDLNHDGKINLVDFSILAYYWTG